MVEYDAKSLDAGHGDRQGDRHGMKFGSASLAARSAAKIIYQDHASESFGNEMVLCDAWLGPESGSSCSAMRKFRQENEPGRTFPWLARNSPPFTGSRAFIPPCAI